MQTDKVAKARAVRRRLADMRQAKDLETRGWACSPPKDEIQAEVSKRDDRH